MPFFGWWAVIKPFLPAILIGLVALAVAGTIWGYGRSRYNAGVAKTEAIYAPKLLACSVARDDAVQANKVANAAIKALQTMYGDLEQAIKNLEAREQAARMRGEALLAEASRKEHQRLKEAARLKAIIEAPPAATRDLACDGADVLLTEEAQRRAPQ